MQVETTAAKYTIREEIANSITHGMGILLSLVGLIVLLICAVRSGDIFRVISSIVFGTALILLYTISTLYHSIVQRQRKWESRWGYF